MIVVSNITKMATMRFTRLSRNSVVMESWRQHACIKKCLFKIKKWFLYKNWEAVFHLSER